MMLGTKIENLKKLKKNNINVPAFIVIKSDDFIDNKFYENDIPKNYDSNKLSGILKEKLETYFKDINLDLNNKKYAVRSSCNLEDSDKFSFAGQFDTYLNVEKNDVMYNVKKCFKSLYNNNVLEYLKENKININDMRMNVIVQEMVESDISGVLFTSNTNGLLNESVIVAGFGLGEGVVSDKVDTTTYYYNLDDEIFYYEGKNDLLSSDMIDELISVSKQIKKILGDYLDIEFAIKDNIIYILQTRKITTINDDNILILDNSNIVESYPNISLPLTCSFVNVVYSGVFKGVSKRVLKDDKELDLLNNIFYNMVGNANGRIYYKISNWYQIIKFLPFSNKIIPIWQEMLGVKNKNVNVDNIKRSTFKKIKTYINFFYELLHTTKNMKKLNLEFININKYFYEEYDNGLTEGKTKELYDNVKSKLLSCWDITLLNDIYTFIFTSLFKKRILKKYPNDLELSNKYISGISNIESMKPIKELINIAYKFDSMSDKEKEEKIDNYIKIYGDRNLEELKLESKTFRTNKELLIDKINCYNEDKNKLKEMYQNINKDQDTTLNEIKLDYISKKLLDKCKKGIENREISRLNRSRIFGMVREMMLFYGTIYQKQKLIADKNDIFYLEIDEVFDLVNNKHKMQKIIAERKENYKIYEMLPNYSRLIFADHEFNKSHISINSNKVEINKNELKGIPCSNGLVMGEVLVIDNIDNIKNVKDKILVTKMTDPGWVFLLATAKGVISEKGSLLSHTAIISRELKIPSIVGVENLLNIIHTGDIIEMDGTTGKIKIIKRCR